MPRNTEINGKKYTVKELVLQYLAENDLYTNFSEIERQFKANGISISNVMIGREITRMVECGWLTEEYVNNHYKRYRLTEDGMVALFSMNAKER